MVISEIEAFVVEQRLEKPFYFSQWAYDSRQICLVKLISEDGSYGLGGRVRAGRGR